MTILQAAGLTLKRLGIRVREGFGVGWLGAVQVYGSYKNNQHGSYKNSTSNMDLIKIQL